MSRAAPAAGAAPPADQQDGWTGRVGGAGAADPLFASPPPAVATRAIRVAFCVDSMESSGGTELNAVRTAEAIDPSRVALTVFAMRPDGPMRERYAAAGVRVIGTPPVRTLVAPTTARQAWRLARILREHGIDVVHTHDVYTNWFVGVAARLAGRPLLTSKRWVGGRRGHLLLNRIAYRMSHRVLANSVAVARTLVVDDGVARERVAVVPNFVEDAAFADLSDADRRAVRDAWGFPSGSPVVGCVARLRPEKGQAVLLRAAARLIERFPTMVVALVGDGPEETRLRALATELGIAGRVCFAGHRPNRPNPHQLFDVSVLASDHEGFPNTVVEAMAAGRPVLASDVGGIPDAVDHGVTGLLTRPGDSAAVADALARLLGDPAEAGRMGSAGRATAWARFRTTTVIDRLTEVYTSLLRRPSWTSSAEGR